MSDRSVDEVLAVILRDVQPAPVERRSLLDALGAVLAEPVDSPRSLPPAAVSAMDGFAVRAADVASPPVRLRVVGVVPAGRPPERGLEVGEAVRILTGATMPAGADAVVVAERAAVHGDVVEVPAVVTPGDNVRPEGDALRRGDRLLERAVVLDPAGAALLASAGVAEVSVHRPPPVGIISTGDELVAPGVEAGPGQIHDSNSTLLAALLTDAGCGVEPRRCGDDPAHLGAIVDELRERTDLVLTTGGVSMGQEYDAVVTLARQRGLTVTKLALKPGRPLVHGTLSGTPFLGLPGNPVAAAVLFEVLVRPVLRRRTGQAPVVPPFRGVAARPVGQDDRARVQLVRVRQREDGRWEPTEAQGSHQLTGLVGADALARVEPGAGPVLPGEELALIALPG